VEEENFQTILFPTLKPKLEELGFAFHEFSSDELIWGFDGVTKYYPEDHYRRQPVDSIPSISLKIRKTNNGMTVTLNSVPFKEKLHLDKGLLKEEQVIDLIEKYLKTF
jgi:hypothetical protein